MSARRQPKIGPQGACLRRKPVSVGERVVTQRTWCGDAADRPRGLTKTANKSYSTPARPRGSMAFLLALQNL
jgi:hypothetical protein